MKHTIQMISRRLFLLLSTCLAMGMAVAAEEPPATASLAGQANKPLNLFRELRPAVTEAEIDRKLARYWQSLFEGDEASRVYYPAGATADGPSAYVLDVANNDVRSEGMSYGMMIAVQTNHKPAFDALWNWAATHMRYSQGPRAGYFRWQCRPPGCKRDEVPASDGEEYFATALLMASSRWGDGKGIYAYAEQANALLDVMLHKEAINGGVVDGVRSMFSADAGQVVFVPIGDSALFSDPSYHLPAFYELWAQRAKGWGGKQAQDRQRWSDIAQISRQYFVKSAHPDTALMPDYAEFDGRPKHLDGHGDFRFDAFRTAANWAVDQAWWGKNPAAIGLSRRLLTFFNSQARQPYPAQYRINGLPISEEAASGLVACNAVAALLVEWPLAERFVSDLWALEPPTGKWRYYNGLLQFMATLQVSGRFRPY